MRSWLTGLLAGVLLLGGCASLMSATVSESSLERQLEQAILDFDRQQLSAGSPLAIELDSAEVTVGPRGRDTVRLDVAGQAAFTALASRLPADIALSLEGTPYYDAEEQAVYIRRLQLLDGRIDAPWMPLDLAPMTRLAARAMAQWLERVPVYRLENASWGRRALARNMQLRVEPGRLVFAPRN